MNLRYRSTGKLVVEPTRNEAPREVRETREDQMKRIRAHREQERVARDERLHDLTVKGLDEEYKDVCSNPELMRHMDVEVRRLYEQSAITGRPVDLANDVSAIAENLRKGAGLPYGTERRHQEALAEMARERVESKKAG